MKSMFDAKFWLVVAAALVICGVALPVDNTGAPMYDTDGNPAATGVDTAGSGSLRWLLVDSDGRLAVTAGEETLYPYFTSGVFDTTMVDSLFEMPLPVVSFWLLNRSSTDTLYVSWLGPSHPASYLPVFPLQSFGLEDLWLPISASKLYMDASADSVPWALAVVSNSLYVP